MRALSGGVLGAAPESTATEDTRKTRLSFELHPSTFLDDSFVDDSVTDDILSFLFGEDDLYPHISNTARAAR